MTQSISAKLELKVIPVYQVFIALLAMYLLKKYLPELHVTIPMNLALTGIALIFSFIIGVLSVYLFKRYGTTVNPSKPEHAAIVVDKGIFRLSRNPMYLALVLVLLSAFFYLQNMGAIMIIALFIYYITRFQIIPEERALTALFGEEYLAYQQQVRRWL